MTSFFLLFFLLVQESECASVRRHRRISALDELHVASDSKEGEGEGAKGDLGCK